MPSPIAHSATGLLLYRLAGPEGVRSESDRRQRLLTAVYFVFVANLPDLDFIPQILTGERYHHGATHSLVFGALVAVILAAASSRLLGAAFPRLLVWSLVTLFSHLLLDLFTAGGSGIPLFWPFSGELYQSPLAFFPETHHSKGLYLRGQIVFVLFETAYAGLLLASHRVLLRKRGTVWVSAD